ncbi:MFS transporter [Paraglaciecola aestuariivivens]
MSQKSQKPFLQLIGISSFTKLADLLISAKTTLPWLLTSLGAPAWIISLLVPIRESGSLIPQWPIKQRTQKLTNRLILWRAGIVIQTLAIGLILLAALFTQNHTAGLLILLFLLILSLGRALTSLSMKDIQGINISKGQRGKLVGIASSISGILSLLTAALMLYSPNNQSNLAMHGLLGLSIAVMLISLVLSRGLTAELQDQDNTDQQTGIWRTIRTQASLRNLIVSRCLLLHGALIAPFFVSASASHATGFSLPYYIIASALAAFISSYLWGKLADKSAVKTLFFATFVCVIASFSFFFLSTLQWPALNVGLFFILNLGYAGVRTGRKTYILDIAEGSQRTIFVAAANTCVGYVLLLLGGLYALLHLWISDYIVLLMALVMTLGLVHTFSLPAEK